jgi:peptidyl-Lys metalloendopeptidase
LRCLSRNLLYLPSPSALFPRQRHPVSHLRSRVRQSYIFVHLCQIRLNYHTGPGDVTDVESLKIVATVKNIGDEEIKLLKDPSGVLSQAPTNTFSISSDAGSVPSFRGMKVKYSSNAAIAQQDESLFTVLAPGATIDVEHDRKYAKFRPCYSIKAHTFHSWFGLQLHQLWRGNYNIEASNLFYFVDPSTGVASELRADTAEATHLAKLTGKLSTTARNTGLSKRIAFQSCSSSEQSTIRTAASAAQTYAEESERYVFLKK